MENQEFQEFMKHQIKAIEIYKWVESEKARRDLGNEAIKTWIGHFAEQFRKRYERISGSIVEEIFSEVKDIASVKCRNCKDKEQLKLIITAVLEKFVEKKLFLELKG